MSRLTRKIFYFGSNAFGCIGTRYFLYVAISALVVGCGEKTTALCTHSGGSCCHQKNSDGTTAGLVCLSSYEKCQQSAPRSGTAVWQYTSDLKSEKDAGYCERQARTVPFWSADPFTYLFRAALVKSRPASVVADGKTIQQGDPEYCRALCLTGDAGLCPELPLRNDVSLANLLLIQRVAENPPKTMYVYPIEEILNLYRVDAKTNLCHRGDLVVTPTSAVNASSEECNSEINQTSSLGDVDVELISHKNIASTFVPNSKIASYELPEGAVSLKVNDSSLAPYYSGPIRYTGRMTDTEIFAQINAQNMSCGRIVPIEDVRHSIKSLSVSVDHDNSLVKAALLALSEFYSAVMASTDKPTQERVKNLSVSDEILPRTAYFDALQGIVREQKLKVKIPEYVMGDKDHSQTVDSILRLIDVYECSVAQHDTPVERLLPLIPVADAYPDLDLLDKRDRVAGAILQCKFSSNYISKASADVLKYVLSEEGTKQ